MKRLLGLPPLLFLPLITLSAQRPADAPLTATAGKSTDTVFLEDLTWAEVRDLVRTGTTTVIVGTAGSEQRVPNIVVGGPKVIMDYGADKLARALGKTLVAPTIGYVPEGSCKNPSSHMSKPDTITLPEDRFVELLVDVGRSLKAGGFTTILFLGESSGAQSGMRSAAEKLNVLWNSAARVFWVDNYYTKSLADQHPYLRDKLGVAADRMGTHANVLDTSEMLFVSAKHVRKNTRARGGGPENSGVNGDSTKSTPGLGKIFLQIKIDNALTQIRRLMAGTISAARASNEAGFGECADSSGASQSVVQVMTANAAPASISTSQAPDTVLIDELTWEETRGAIRTGRTTVIVPTGGMEQNGYHMVLGKHDFVVTYAANLMARRLKNALVAPTIQYVPEGDPDRMVPGAISLPSPAYDMLLDSVAHSLRSLGFTDILFIGDSGGNQEGITDVANRLNEEWRETGARVFPLVDYYEQGRVHYRAWMLAAFGYDDAMVGGHAGISDTSQMLFVRPAGVRKDQIKPWGGPQDAGVSGDPTKATAEIGKMGIEFKVNAGISQYRRLKNEAQRARGNPAH